MCVFVMKVCAITSGGCYAQFVAVPVAQLLPIPVNTSLKEAATFPQATCTVWSELFMKERLSERLEVFEKKGARLSIGETLLVINFPNTLSLLNCQLSFIIRLITYGKYVQK